MARELIANTPNFNYDVQDTAWRVEAKQTLIDLYTSLRDAGMSNPIQGMGGSMRALFWVLVPNEEYKILRRTV